MSNAEAIAATLAKMGVEFAFGLPGGEVTALLHACRAAGIRFMLTGHEASAAFMADVTGQITGRPGICIATLGPGAMNLCLGAAHAYLDRSPVLAFTAETPRAIARHYSHQRLPLTRTFGTICKASVAISGRGTAELVESAARLAAAPHPGPVHIALSSDIAGKNVRPGPPPRLKETARADRAPQNALEEIAGRLSEARRPLVMVGIGCPPRDAPAVRRFVDRVTLPYVVTPKAKGMLPEDGPGFLGVIGGMAIDREIMKTVDQADLLMGVGFDPIECDDPWYVGRPIVNLSRAPTRMGRYRPLEVIGEIPELLRLLDGADARPWPSDLLAECRARLRPRPIRAEGAVSPLEAIEAAREVLPAQTILTSDVGSHKYYAGQFWRARAPQTFFMSNGLSAMGYGVPAAIAAKLHFPRQPVVALVGDGGLLMMLHNLVFIRQHRVPVIIVCFIDDSLSLIRISQQRRGHDPYGVDFPAPDFARAADAFGVRGRLVDSIDALKRALDEAVRAGEPALIAVRVNMREYEAYV